MTKNAPDTQELLSRVAKGDHLARSQLLKRHRQRLKRMIVVHLDRRLAARLDPSDVVQDVLAQADQNLNRYVEAPPIAFYPWLRSLAWDRLIELHRYHIGAKKRSVEREVSLTPVPPDDSLLELARLLAAGSSPSHQVVRKELRQRVQHALAQLSDQDREILVLRHMEQLSTQEMAEILDLGVSAVKMRHLRALQRLKELLEE